MLFPRRQKSNNSDFVPHPSQWPAVVGCSVNLRAGIVFIAALVVVRCGEALTE